ncbi:primase-helicase family protein [Ideonella dechloratans]|uniref:primase-helicase family protein n=1 Tax=Ideonella dechloratans TaxID=36863 RepID=UPI0035AE1129
MEQNTPNDQPLSPVAKAAKTFVYVGQVDKVFNVTNQQFMPLTALARRICASGDDVADTVAALLHNERGLVKVDTVAFAPGKDTIFEDEHGNECVNLWTKVELSPVEGDTAPFIRHLNLIFDQDETAVNFMLDFMAHMLQKPTVKLMCAPLIIGGQGIGKSMLGEFFACLVGERNTTFIDLNDLSSQFNGYARAHLIIVNEFSSSASKTVRALLKGLITSPTISLNQKNIAAIQIANHANLMMFSNDPAALPLERDDRRYFAWISRAKRQPPEYYAELAAWMKGDGAAHTLHYLLNRDLSGFNPNAAPPTNASREALIHEAMSDQHQMLLELFEAGQPPFATDLVVTSDVAEFMNTLRGPRFTVRHVASFLQQIGAAALGQCRITDADGAVRKPRIWAVANTEGWVGRQESEIARAYRKPGLPTLGAAPIGSSSGSGLDRPRPCYSRDASDDDSWVTPQL